MTANWKGPDGYGYWYAMTDDGISLNVQFGIGGWIAYVDGEPIPGAFPSRAEAQEAAEAEAAKVQGEMA
jgi:hypothetical protein